MRLEGKVALISGAASGMGQSEATIFAREGARVVVADLLESEGRQVAEKVRAQMIDETHSQQQQMLERARREIEQEKVRAIAEMRREAVELAIAGASKVIEKNLDDQANRKIVETFLSSIPAGGANRG